jgi:hypothetical protein
MNVKSASAWLHLQASGIVRCLRNASDLQDKQVKELAKEVDDLRKALESQNSR